jgi:quercetin dioxygenase-like cupin family protein
MTSAAASTNPDQPAASRPTTIWWQGALMTLKAHHDSTGGALALVEARFPAGFGPPLHVHHREDEAIYVLDGRLRWRHGDQERTYGPGELVFGPRELPHTFKAGPDGALALVLLTPAGFEGMFQEGGVPARDTATPPVEHYDVERVAELAARYGMDVVGPPLP